MDIISRRYDDFDAAWDSYYRQTFGNNGSTDLITLLREHERLKNRAEQIEVLDREMKEHLLFYRDHYRVCDDLDFRYAHLQNRIARMRLENRELLRLSTSEMERYICGRNGVSDQWYPIYYPHLRRFNSHGYCSYEADARWARIERQFHILDNGWRFPVSQTSALQKVHFPPEHYTDTRHEEKERKEVSFKEEDLVEEEDDEEYKENVKEKEKNEAKEKVEKFSPKTSVPVEEPERDVTRLQPKVKIVYPCDSENGVGTDIRLDRGFRAITEQNKSNHQITVHMDDETKQQCNRDREPETEKRVELERKEMLRKEIKTGGKKPKQVQKRGNLHKYKSDPGSLSMEEMGEQIINGMKRNLQERLCNVNIGRPGSALTTRSSNSEISDEIYGKYRNQRLFPDDTSASVDERGRSIARHGESPRHGRSQSRERKPTRERTPTRRMVERFSYTEEDRDTILRNVKRCIMKDIKFSIYSQFQKRPGRRARQDW